MATPRNGAPSAATTRLADALEALHQQRQRARALRAAPGFPEAPPVSANDRRRQRGSGLRVKLDRLGAWYEQLAKLYGLAIELTFASPARRGRGPGESPAAEAVAPPDRQIDAEVAALLERAERLLLKYPVAAQAAFAALAAEGRAFARTPEGARYEAALRHSRAFARHWSILEKVTNRLFVESGRLTLPSAYLDALAQGAGLADLRPLMARLIGGGEDDAPR